MSTEKSRSAVGLQTSMRWSECVTMTPADLYVRCLPALLSCSVSRWIAWSDSAATKVCLSEM